MNHPSSNHPPSAPETETSSPVLRRPPQVSLGFMMLLMVIFAMMSAGLLYGSRVPALRQEWGLLWGGKVGSSSAGSSRVPHIVFIMFTYTSPLLLAGALSIGVTVMRWVRRR